MLITMSGSSRNRGWNVIVRMSEISMNILLRSSLREGFFDIVKVLLLLLVCCLGLMIDFGVVLVLFFLVNLLRVVFKPSGLLVWAFSSSFSTA
jgi:hypothetical protein